MPENTLTFSFVIPVFNEEENLSELHRRIAEVLDRLEGSAEVIFVDDGSSDRSASIIADLHDIDPRVNLVQFSRNFGHQTAVTAGLDFSKGEAVIVMDADLQDPPEIVLEMVERWKEG